MARHRKWVRSAQSISPDEHYHLVLARTGTSGAGSLSYELIESKTRRVVWKIPSSYQLEGEDDSFDLKNAQDAEVYWNKESTRFALDEANYRCKGNLIVGTAYGRRVSCKAIHPSAMGVRQSLERWRVRVDKGWLSTDRLSLELSGVCKQAGEFNPVFTRHFVCTWTNDGEIRFAEVDGPK